MPLIDLRLMFALLQAASTAPSPAPLNPGFETVDANGSPAGWTFAKGASDLGYRFESVEGASGKGTRLRAAALAVASRNSEATISQTVDAAPYRGKLVRFSARLRVDSDLRSGGRQMASVRLRQAR